MKVVHAKGPEQQVLPSSGGSVPAEREEQRGQERGHLLEEPSQSGRDRPRRRRASHVASEGGLYLLVMNQVSESCQHHPAAEIADQVLVAVHRGALIFPSDH